MILYDIKNMRNHIFYHFRGNYNIIRSELYLSKLQGLEITMESKIRISLSIDRELNTKLDQLLEKYRIKYPHKSYIINLAVKAFLENEHGIKLGS